MKKILLILLLSIFLIPNVDAEEVNYIYTLNKEECNANLQTYEQYKNLINQALEEYSTSTDYYVIIKDEAGALNDINLIIFDNDSSVGFEINSLQNDFYIQNYKVKVQFYNNQVSSVATRETYEDLNGQHRNLSSFFPNNLIYGNYNFKLTGYSEITFEGFYKDDINIKTGETLPYLVNLYNYSSWSDYITDNNPIYTTVNLDNYEYVILKLKNYNQSTFNTNLKVKGMIGITPVYEFGTIEKELITDRCNISYFDYTDYRFSILKNDLINNAVYYVKGCQDGSSFKFVSTIFDITYITADNVNDPVITFGGVEYHTIPFNKLSNSANQNEDNNFIPGSSEQFNPIEGVTEYISKFWTSLTTFMGFVTKFFNTLPIEIRAISITTFTTAITLGIIKFLKA